MKLAYSPTSPYVRKVMVVLHETDQLDDVELIETATTPMDAAPNLLPQNPLGKVPALERSDGPALFDSRVICAYLDHRVQAGLYGADGRDWEIRTLEALADGILDAALLMVYESRLRPDTERSDAWVEAQWEKVSRAVDTLNTRWISHLSGSMHIGQIAVGCALGYVDLRHDARGWRSGNDALAQWYQTFESRPSMQATAPPKG